MVASARAGRESAALLAAARAVPGARRAGGPHRIVVPGSVGTRPAWRSRPLRLHTGRPMTDQSGEKDCCRRTRERWLARIRAYFTSFPVIKDVPCDECREILEIRVYSRPAA